GYLGTKKAGRLGAFMKGEDPVTLAEGALANPTWKLVKVTDVSAEFQNLRFPDLKYRIDAVEPRGGGSSTPANEF
ncbi:MAG TPA: hypothetical protein VK188_18295, partial [Holophaga sp.]|nr:hypothetical protein [Holophaga sp.]